MKSKLLISLTDVCTSGFAVSSNSEHFGAAQGESPLPFVQARDQVQIPARRLETDSFTVNIPIRCLARASGRNSAGERRWLKVVFSIGRRHVDKVLIQAGNRITVHPVKIARITPFPRVDESVSPRRHPDRAPSRAHSIVHTPDAARSIVVIQNALSLNFDPVCVARRSGDIIAGSVPQEPF